jgi:hypothetical protein
MIVSLIILLDIYEQNSFYLDSMKAIETGMEVSYEHNSAWER